MKLDFNIRKPKNKQVGVRLTTEEYNQIAKIAKDNKVYFSEAVAVLIRGALKEYKKIK